MSSTPATLRSRIPDPVRLFSDYMKLTGTPSLAVEKGDARLTGKSIGLVNGSTWISLWGTWFGRQYLPGVKLVHCGSDAVQLRFMAAHHAGQPCPPPENIKAFVHASRELVSLHHVNAILITCSTMNRAAAAVRRALRPVGTPVIQIDEAMMEMAVNRAGRILVVATHGPTVSSTHALLQETAAHLGRQIEVDGVTVESAFEHLGAGDISRHNREIKKAIRDAQKRIRIDSVVLAQLSMSVFALEYPYPKREFGVPVFTSGQCGFQRLRELLLSEEPASAKRPTTSSGRRGNGVRSTAIT